MDGYQGCSWVKKSCMDDASFLSFISLPIVASIVIIDNDFTFISNFRDIYLGKCLLSCGIIALTSFWRSNMEFLVERTVAAFIALLCPLLTMFDLPGNSILLLTGLAFAFFDENMYFNGRLLSAMVLVYLVGEAWEFCVSLFGIKKEKVSWWAVFLIGLGGFVGTLFGTTVFPVLGSILGGVLGASAIAFLYELARTGLQKDAARLAWEAAKMRFLAILGKICAGIALAALLLKQVFF